MAAAENRKVDDPRTGTGAGRTISGLLEELVSPDIDPGADGSAWAPPPPPGTVVGRFQLVREIGRGGFGIVYEAVDRDLGRSVAFKLLRTGPRPNAGEDRFLREAEAAARLSHPNVVTLYDVGRCEYGPYLVLELLTGRTLSQRVAEGSVPLAEALRIAVEVGRALAQAHARGIVHRDLTPGNVFLCEDGHVKLLDLGMAQAFGRRKLEGGTPAFMAPEQWRGAPEDERTDVFALGVILYRMLAGELPFPEDGGRTASGSRPAPGLDVPGAPGLTAVVARMLAKDPVERYRDAGATVAALTPFLRAAEGASSSEDGTEVSRRSPRRSLAVTLAAVLAAVGAVAAWKLLAPRREAPGTLQPAGAIPAVAVLPFADLSPGGDQAHFADGLAEEILNALGQVDGLRVAGRTSSFTFRGRKDALGEIGRALHVDAVLDGSVRKSGQRLRVTAQLVGVRDGYQLWSRTFDREVKDVFAVQDEIARAVAGALRVKLTPPRDAAAAERRTAVPEAYAQYLLGRRHYQTRGSSEGYLRAAAAFQNAVAADPGFAPAWAGLALALAGSADLAGSAEEIADQKRRAIDAAERAVTLGPDLPDGFLARGTIRAGILRDWPGARDDFERSLALNPAQPDTLRRYGVWYLGAHGRYAEAVDVVRRAAEIDPLLVYAWDNLALLQIMAGRLDDAAVSTRRSLEIAPDDRYAIRHLVVGGVLAGKPAEALEAAERFTDPPWRQWSLALAQHALGNEAASRAALDELERAHGDGFAFQIAQAHAFRGEVDEAFRWLDRAIEQRDMGVVLEVKGDPLLRAIRGDPRYARVLARLKLPAD